MHRGDACSDESVVGGPPPQPPAAGTVANGLAPLKGEPDLSEKGDVIESPGEAAAAEGEEVVVAAAAAEGG
jgi:hypothetical protein